MVSLADLLRPSAEFIEREFYYEFGRFICAFAKVEITVHGLFRKISGLKGDKARTIVAGAKIGRMMDVTKQMANLKESKFSTANKKELETLFSHLSAISNFRNDLVHSGADIEKGEIRSVNFNKAKTIETVQEIKFDLVVMRNATIDLNTIQLRLFHLVRADKWTRKHVPKMRQRPWLYKSPPANNWWKRILVEELRRVHPPQSSEVKP